MNTALVIAKREIRTYFNSPVAYIVVTVFMLLAGQLLGPGVAALGVLIAATGANLLDAFVQPTSHVSAGASTAVFATLGLLSAYAWRRRANDRERWAYRWAPLLAGTCLLAFTGVGDEHTDVLAHLTGFASGALAGAWLASRPQPFGAAMQWLSGLACGGTIALAWGWGLASGLGH
jgi:membrane associated rhomboid family serine protease